MVYLGAIGKDMGDEVDSGGCWWGAKDATTAITVDDKKDWDEVVGSAKMKVWQNSRLGTNSWVNPEIKQTSAKNIKQRRNQSNIGRNFQESSKSTDSIICTTTYQQTVSSYVKYVLLNLWHQ